MSTEAPTTPKPVDSVTTEILKEVVVRFAGDSGDGMQLTGTQFTRTSAQLGNDLATLPDFPAEIRAPAGTLPGVSAFQVRIADYDIHTPGDAPDVLVAMNPAALKKSLADLKPNGIIIANTDEFKAGNLKKAGYEENPLEDGSLEGYRLFTAAITTMTRRALEECDLDSRSKTRSKNMFALGMIYWLFSRPLDSTIGWLERKFAGKPLIAEANVLALKAGYNLADITQMFQVRYEVEPAKLPPGSYRNIMGNSATALGLVAASRRSGLPLFLGSYPITPASDILHELSKYKKFGVTTFQAEDEIAAIAAAIGASFGGALAITTTSGPGLALKSEALNLALMVELPLVVVNVQRGGPSTGLPTKTSSRICYRQCSDATASRRCRYWPRPRRPTVSMRRSRPAVLPVSTWCRCCCCPTATSPTVPSPGCCRGSRTCQTCVRSFIPIPRPFNRTSAMQRRCRGLGRFRELRGSSTVSVDSRRRRSLATSPTTR
jgi:2-oxoglutarate ferredoxin oxidoreductase subunit alpha